MPTSDVMKVGGWDDQDALRKCQQADHATMLRVLEDAMGLREGVGWSCGATPEGVAYYTTGGQVVL